MVIYAPHHGEVWMTVWEIAELLNVTGTAVKNTIKRIWKQSVLKDFQHSQYIKLENGYSAHVYDMEVIIAIALQMDTYQALLFRQWFISKVVNRRKNFQAEQVKHEYPMIIVMNGTMPGELQVRISHLLIRFLHLYNIIAYRGNDFCRCTLYAILVSLL